MAKLPEDTMGAHEALGRGSRRVAFICLLLAGLCALAIILLGTTAKESSFVPAVPFLGGAALWLVILGSYATLRLCRSGEGIAKKLATLAGKAHGASFDRLYLDLRLEEEQERANRYGGVSTLLHVGVDFLRDLGEIKDPEAGEKILEAARGGIPRLLRHCDVVSRLDGPEMLVLLPETDRRKARVVAERLRNSIERNAIEIPGVGEVDFARLSIGIAAFPINGETMENAVSAARTAMKRAQELGGNTIAVSDEFIRSDEVGRPLVKQVRGLKT